MNHDCTELPPLENLLVAALYLATNFAKSGCPRLSHMILHQLQYVLNHPGENISPMIQETCQRLYETWEGIHAERTLALSNADSLGVMRRVH